MLPLPPSGRVVTVHVIPEPWLQRQVKVTSIPTPVASPGGTELTSVRFCIGKPANYTAYSDQGATKQQFKAKMTRFGKKIKQKSVPAQLKTSLVMLKHWMGKFAL